ncbi:MAG: hypothetical protein N3D12_04440 [Candidatus Methanomethyliaceae archaeon]|nr:hypothetical protein [Candidatus Methanomethyliaceae archaeon]
MIEIDAGVIEFVKNEAKRLGINRPAVLILDCGCMMNEEAVELDIKEDQHYEGYELYNEVEGIKFYIKSKIRRAAEGGKIGLKTYGAGKFKRLEFYPRTCQR